MTTKPTDVAATGLSESAHQDVRKALDLLEAARSLDNVSGRASTNHETRKRLRAYAHGMLTRVDQELIQWFSLAQATKLPPSAPSKPSPKVAPARGTAPKTASGSLAAPTAT